MWKESLVMLAVSFVTLFENYLCMAVRRAIFAAIIVMSLLQLCKCKSDQTLPLYAKGQALLD